MAGVLYISPRPAVNAFYITVDNLLLEQNDTHYTHS